MSPNLARWSSGKEFACQCRRHKRQGFNPWVRKIAWRRAWQPPPVFLPRESHGQKSLIGYSPRGHKESDTTEVTQHARTHAPSTVSSLPSAQQTMPGRLKKKKNKLMCIKYQQRKQKMWVTEKLTQFNCFKIGIPQWFVIELRIQVQVRKDTTTPKR